MRLEKFDRQKWNLFYRFNMIWIHSAQFYERSVWTIALRLEAKNTQGKIIPMASMGHHVTHLISKCMQLFERTGLILHHFTSA